jgi:thiaminase
MKKDCRECVQKLKEVVNTLPENTRWRELDRLVNQLLKSNQPKDFQSLSGAFSNILQQGV